MAMEKGKWARVFKPQPAWRKKTNQGAGKQKDIAVEGKAVTEKMHDSTSESSSDDEAFFNGLGEPRQGFYLEWNTKEKDPTVGTVRTEQLAERSN